MDRKLAAAATVEWLGGALPKPPLTLLTIGWERTDLSRLADLGYAIRPIDHGSAGEGKSADAALAVRLHSARLASGDWLTWAHEVLPDGHRLLLSVARAADEEHETSGLLVRLAECGFVVLHQEESPLESAGGEIRIVARRDSYIVRGYRPGDEVAILDLFARAFGTRRSAEHFRWKYVEGPYGGPHMSLAFAPDGRLVAHYAGYPVMVEDARDREPRILRAHQVGDTMTDASARSVGRGATSLLGRAVRHFYPAYCEQRVAFNYGFNRGNIQTFSLRFVGANRIEEMAYWVREGPSAMPRRWWRLDQVECVDRITPEWDALFERCAPGYGVLVRRDAEYLRWRYLDCPDGGFRVYAVRRFGRLIGWGVFRSTPQALLWGDALFEPGEERAASALLAFAMRHGAAHSRVLAWFSPRPVWWCRELTGLGFARQPEPQDLALMVVPFAETDATLDLARSLYYTRGDSDLF